MTHSKFILLALAALVLFAGCKKITDSKSVTFFCKGDFTLTSHSPMTKDLSANGSAMTDVWIFDYVNGELVQTVHQDDNTAADFGSPSLDLSYGTHNIYLVASRGTSPTVTTADHTIIWTKPSDSFWQIQTVNVSSSSPSTYSVALDRMVARLKMTINDAIAEGTTQFLVTPQTWYYGMDYTTGNPTASATSQAITINCPSSNIGQSGKYLTVFSFSPTTQWTTDVTLAASDGTNTLASASLTTVPLRRNYSTEYSGNLFTYGAGFTLSLNDTWTDTYTGSW